MSNLVRKPFTPAPNPQCANQSTESPRKKRRISLLSLKSCGSHQKITVGELKKAVCANNPVIRGDLTNVVLECTVVDYMRGRRLNRYDREWTYVNVADATGSVAFGLNETRSGLISFRVPQEDVTEETLCFFTARFKGTFGWNPKREDNTKYIISLRGEVTALSEKPTAIERMKSLVYPTTDVLEQVASEDSAQFCKFVTPAFICQLEGFVSGDSPGTILCSVSDPTGFAILRITDVEDVEEFLADHNLSDTPYVTVEGILKISLEKLDDTPYPCISASTSNTFTLTVIEKSEFQGWEQALLSVPQRKFTGVIPKKED